MNTEKIRLELNNVQKTLLLPLWGRAKETEKTNPILEDQKSVELIKKIDYDFSILENDLNMQNSLSWLIRAKTFDDAIKSFIHKHPNGTIVNIGAGLDTTFFRVDNGNIFWYDLDLPEVIEMRRKLIGESDRVKFISKSFLDFSWFDDIKHLDDDVFFFAGGVFIYYNKETVKGVLHKLSQKFPNGEMMFDTYSKIWNRMANKMIENAGIQNAKIKLEIKNKRELEKWSPYIKIKDWFGYNQKVEKKREWGLTTNLTLIINDLFKITSFYNLEFKE